MEHATDSAPQLAASQLAASGPAAMIVLPPEQWRNLEGQHEERADRLTAGWRARAGTGQTHPVEDFLFTYYPYRPRQLRRWHPGANIVLSDAASTGRADWKWYRRHGHATNPGANPDASSDGASSDDMSVDTEALMQAKGRSIRFIMSLLTQTAQRAGNFGCFGLHEWAMVYREPDRRHPAPLRLSARETDEVVASSRIACTHFDAYRFFTPDAVELNRVRPTRDNQPAMEQPGCLHAGMDVYKWAIKLGPLVPGELLLDAFELAGEIRELDMRASPYDLRDWGYEPVPIETPDGKAEYVRQQRRFAERSNALRGRIVAAVSPVNMAGTASPRSTNPAGPSS